MDRCPFCDLAAGGADEDLIALRTAGAFVLPAPRQRARNRGHSLVLPVRHVTRLSDADGSVLQAVYGLAGRVSAAVRTAFGATGATLFQNDEAPDQTLHHLHVHVVPRTAGDAFRTPDPAQDVLTRDERVRQALALRAALAT